MTAAQLAAFLAAAPTIFGWLLIAWLVVLVACLAWAAWLVTR